MTSVSTRPGTIQHELRRVILERQQFLAHLGRRLGVTPTEFGALVDLCQPGGLTPGELGRRLSFSSGAITALLDRLERLGWAGRERHPDDRRKVVVRLTAAGEQIGELEIGTLVAAIARTAALFSARDQKVIERFLHTAADEFAELVRSEQSLGNTDAEGRRKER
jgi:DNA-binding MarR family transcriptional regulator